MDYIYAAARPLVLWLMVLTPGMIGALVAGSATIGFGSRFLLQSNKDAQQDARMDAADSRDLKEEDERKERRAEIKSRLDIHDMELKDLSDTVHQLYGWGAGAFASVTVLQIVGLLRKKQD